MNIQCIDNKIFYTNNLSKILEQYLYIRFKKFMCFPSSIRRKI